MFRKIWQNAKNIPQGALLGSGVLLALVIVSGQLGAGEYLINHIAFGYGGGASGMMPRVVVAVNRPLLIPDPQLEGQLYHKAANNTLLEVELPPSVFNGPSTIVAEDIAVNSNIEPNSSENYILGGRVYNISGVDEKGNPINLFRAKLTIDITVPELPLDTSNLGAYYLDGNNRWTLIQRATFDPRNKTAFQMDNLAVVAVLNAPGLPAKIEATGNVFPALLRDGTTKAVLGAKRYANGTLVRTADGKIYVIEQNGPRYISSPSELKTFSNKKILDITYNALDDQRAAIAFTGNVLANGGDPVIADTQQVLGVKSQHVVDARLYADGALLRTPDNKVYVVENAVVTQVATLPGSIYQWAGRRVYDISYDELSVYRDQRVVEEIQNVDNVPQYHEGDLLRTRDWKVYIIENGALRHIATLPALSQTTYQGKKINDVDYGTLTQYSDRRDPQNQQAVLGAKSYAINSLLRTPDNKVFVVTAQNQVRHLATLADLQPYAGRTILNITVSDLATFLNPPVAVAPTVSPENQNVAGGPQRVLGVKQYADGTLLRTSDWKLYLVENQTVRVIANVPSPQSQYNGKPILDVDFSVIAEYTRTQ